MRVMHDDDLVTATGGGHPSVSLRSTEEMARHVRAHFDVARFDDWVASAKTRPGSMQLYGCGTHASTACAPGVAKRMRALADAGLVELFQRRRIDGDPAHPFDYLAVRTAKPAPKGFPALPVTHDQQLARTAGAVRERDRSAHDAGRAR